MDGIRGFAWCYGDNVSTDGIIPGKYLRLHGEEAAKHVMEGIDPDFVKRFRPGDVVVGGRNFGCGSSRELAPDSLKQAKVGAVVARSFARIFFRNAINLGFPLFVCSEADRIQSGDDLEIVLETGAISNLSRGEVYQSTPFPEHLRRMLEAGGLVPYLEEAIRSGRIKPAPPAPLRSR
jgi:3-isopropylmalate/(R)-2-methylmalate dehydratase small subunit